MSVKKTVDVEAQTITFAFDDGGEEAVLDIGKLPEHIKLHLMMHGASQKHGDSYAGNKDKARELVEGVYASLVNGEWSVRGEGGPRVTQLARAVAQVTGKPLDEIVEKLAELEKDDRKRLQATPAIAAALAEIKAKDAAEALKKAQEAVAEAGDSGADAVANLLG